MRKVRGIATAVALTLLVAVALVVDASLTAANVRRVAEANAWVGHTHEVLETLQGMLSSLQDAETGQRGFIITGAPEYLAPYYAGRRAAPRRLNRLAELTRDDPPQQKRIDAMRPLVEQKLDELEHVVELRKSAADGFATARAVALSDEGKLVMDALRAKVADMDKAERRRLADRALASAVATRTATVTNVLGLAGSLVLLMAAFGVWRSRTREREHAAALLNDEREKFYTTLTSIGDGVVVTDHAGRITMMNATAGSVLGWNDDAVGRPLDEVFRIVNEHTRKPVESPVQKVLREGKVAGLANHTVLIRQDGRETPIDDSGAPIRNQNGNIVGVVLVFRDIRERREAERELQRRGELLQAQDRHKDEFLATLSHELRNPLAPIRNAVTVLQRAHPASGQMQRATTVIDRQVAHLARLVDDLLDVSRIAQGKVRLQKERVDLAEVVRRTVDDHRSFFATKGVSLEFTEGEPLWVEADMTRLAQVTENLLHNAAKFTSRGGRVAVALAEENGRAMLRVRDNGVGIEKEMLAKVFQPFVQGEKTLHRTLGGLGLGLALTKTIVELHAGSVEALSDGPGKGAEFVIALPLSRNIALRPVTGATPRPRGRLSICVIDDNEDAADSLHDLLELEGHDVHVAMDGQLGIDLVLAVHPDVVLCDVGLPGIDGFEVARRLRAAGSTAMLVALTGYASSEDVQRAQDAGFDHHLAKPTDLDRLDAVLASVAVPEAASTSATAH
jgi:PAS domain S-box-containing protein